MGRYGDLHSHPIVNQLANAVPVEDSSVRYSEMLRNGYARPSLAADSAARILLRLVGTCLRANLPPTIAAQIMGSVGVRHAAMTSEEIKLSGGKMTKIIPENAGQVNG